MRETPTRRQFLRTAGAVCAGGILAGRAGATAPGELLNVNVGYADEGGLDATLSIASEVTRRYEWNALTVRAPRRRLKGLAGRADVRYVEADVEFDSSTPPPRRRCRQIPRRRSSRRVRRSPTAWTASTPTSPTTRA